ncbi:MAG TPA: 16S rRNA (guanine(966)-N(2))-methyltransferase RsmD [Rhabdochlamydiaceae bacterium]|nr:16S rRNA (guanine(966)-N(2))-methyltransferase RsmD [Rhabdochlamydiaceae bacterium]
MLRIIGGKFKSRLIKTPKSTETRPTSSLVRKAFFDICRNEVEDCRFLDLYAGSGAMGIEALSRGARAVTFVESNKQAIRCIKENLELLGLDQQSTLIMKEAILALKMLERAKSLFDLIYIDPPYQQSALSILKFLDDHSMIASGGSIFLEEKSPSKLKIEKELFTRLKWARERKFGMTILNEWFINN